METQEMLEGAEKKGRYNVKTEMLKFSKKIQKLSGK